MPTTEALNDDRGNHKEESNKKMKKKQRSMSRRGDDTSYRLTEVEQYHEDSEGF